MPVLRDDNAARRLDFPVGPATLKAPVAVWGVFLAMLLPLWALAASLIYIAALYVPLAVIVAAFGPVPVAAVAARRSRRWLNRVTPLRYHAVTFVAEVNTPAPEDDLPTTYETSLMNLLPGGAA